MMLWLRFHLGVTVYEEGQKRGRDKAAENNIRLPDLYRELALIPGK